MYTENRTSNIEFLETITQIMGVSGAEKAIISLFKDVVSPFVDSVEYDNIGNLIAHKEGNGEKVMIIAHADEIGFIVRHIDEQGFIYLMEVGGIDTNLLPGSEIKICGINGKAFTGIIGKQPIHLQDKGKPKDWECNELWVDIGAQSREEAQQMVEVGCYASFHSGFERLNKSLVKAKALDDRCGLAVLRGIAKEIQDINPDCDLYLVCSVQEELGARGAHTAAENIKPDIAIAIDVTHATDYPSMSPMKYGDVKLGEGPVVAYGPNIEASLTENLIATANKIGAKIQKEVFARPTGTDINPIQIKGRGVKTALLSIPCRYMHTPVEMVSMEDIESAIKIITEYIKK